MVSLMLECSVCLNPCDEAVQLDGGPDGESLIMKLRHIVPEVEWSENYRICKACLLQLNVAYEFRILCVRLDHQRKTALAVRQKFTCYHCNSSFSEKEVLAQHLSACQISTELPKLKCDRCGKLYSSRKVLKAHLNKCGTKARKTRNFSCEVCNLVLDYAKLIVEHCINEHAMERKSVRPYVCDECPMRFASSANLIQHKKYHKGSRSHICSFCGKSYITKGDLTVHEYIHFNRRNYKCDLCDKAFNTNKNLRSHNLVVHTDSSMWKYSCDLCQRRFPLKSGYEQHLKRHAGDKKFVCHICPKSFVSSTELRKHISYHSKVKAFKCSHCDRAYRERRAYDIHLSRIHGIGDMKVPPKIKKFACHICPGTFFDKQKLDRHLRTHLGLKPYACKACEKKFADKYYLKQHMKNVHNLGEIEYFLV